MFLSVSILLVMVRVPFHFPDIPCFLLVCTATDLIFFAFYCLFHYTLFVLEALLFDYGNCNTRRHSYISNHSL